MKEKILLQIEMFEGGSISPYKLVEKIKEIITIDKIAEKVKNSDDLSTEINNLITEEYGYNPELEDKVIELISNEMEFIDEIATQLTEEKFKEDCYYWYGENESKMIDEAQDYYNERYDEVETLYINLIKKQRK
jgi:uncharacterized protein (DUF433 family)